jgi:hypothetical protein
MSGQVVFYRLSIHEEDAASVLCRLFSGCKTERVQIVPH